MDDLPPQVAHQRDMEAAIRKQHEDDMAARKAESDERYDNETPEAEAARWDRIMRQSAAERESERVLWRESKRGVDSRMFGP